MTTNASVRMRSFCNGDRQLNTGRHNSFANCYIRQKAADWPPQSNNSTWLLLVTKLGDDSFRIVLVEVDGPDAVQGNYGLRMEQCGPQRIVVPEGDLITTHAASVTSSLGLHTTRKAPCATLGGSEPWASMMGLLKKNRGHCDGVPS
ncbi:hypothetical protein PV04_03861 [Phialophora macrospora]|uniref:Uncharacterized protein n=1 Tax=Phialophora macrospora TaxID=1851006 RepID=A0A0D2D2K3_9EURO|nr:hypothetical protein PV04_03861 [Phialophora macrospora]